MDNWEISLSSAQHQGLSTHSGSDSAQIEPALSSITPPSNVSSDNKQGNGFSITAFTPEATISTNQMGLLTAASPQMTSPKPPEHNELEVIQQLVKLEELKHRLLTLRAENAKLEAALMGSSSLGDISLSPSGPSHHLITPIKHLNMEDALPTTPTGNNSNPKPITSAGISDSPHLGIPQGASPIPLASVPPSVDGKHNSPAASATPGIPHGQSQIAANGISTVGNHNSHSSLFKPEIRTPSNLQTDSPASFFHFITSIETFLDGNGCLELLQSDESLAAKLQTQFYLSPDQATVASRIMGKSARAIILQHMGHYTSSFVQYPTVSELMLRVRTASMQTASDYRYYLRERMQETKFEVDMLSLIANMETLFHAYEGTGQSLTDEDKVMAMKQAILNADPKRFPGLHHAITALSLDPNNSTNYQTAKSCLSRIMPTLLPKPLHNSVKALSSPAHTNQPQRYCNYHKSNSHSNDECRQQKQQHARIAKIVDETEGPVEPDNWHLAPLRAKEKGVC